MSERDFTLTLLLDQTPAEVFAAINNVRAWWSGEIDGETDKLGAEFRYRYEDMHDSTQRITELEPGHRVSWHVVDARLSFVDDPREWAGTDIVFDIAAKDGGSEVRFTHVGLAPQRECYDACSNAWGSLVSGNLRRLIATGEPQPNALTAG